MLGREATGTPTAGVTAPALQLAYGVSVRAMGSPVRSGSPQSASCSPRPPRGSGISCQSRRECLDAESGARGNLVFVSDRVGQARGLDRCRTAGAAPPADAVCTDACRGAVGAWAAARRGTAGGRVVVRIGLTVARGATTTRERRGFRAARDHGASREGCEGPHYDSGGRAALAIGKVSGCVTRPVSAG